MNFISESSISQWQRLGPVEDFAPGKARFIVVAGRELAVFRLADPDRFIVTQNSCPHAGGNLSAGTIRGAIVTCPWHQWEFDLDKGSCTLAEDVTLLRYDWRVEDSVLWAKLPTT